MGYIWVVVCEFIYAASYLAKIYSKFQLGKYGRSFHGTQLPRGYVLNREKFYRRVKDLFDTVYVDSLFPMYRPSDIPPTTTLQ